VKRFPGPARRKRKRERERERKGWKGIQGKGI
jgi:hypothetical protein